MKKDQLLHQVEFIINQAKVLLNSQPRKSEIDSFCYYHNMVKKHIALNSLDDSLISSIEKLPKVKFTQLESGSNIINPVAIFKRKKFKQLEIRKAVEVVCEIKNNYEKIQNSLIKN